MKTETFMSHADLEMFLECPDVIVVDIDRKSRNNIVLTYYLGSEDD